MEMGSVLLDLKLPVSPDKNLNYISNFIHKFFTKSIQWGQIYLAGPSSPRGETGAAHSFRPSGSHI